MLALAIAVLTQAQVTPDTAGATRPAGLDHPTSRPAIAGRRIVKHFDFDERRFGNYDPLPMYWRRHGVEGFPSYLEGQFDKAVGHEAAPSFRLDLDGGSLAYHYEGRDISVRTNSDYLVVAQLKTHSLETARAYLTACYLDRKGAKIAGTERRSKLVGGADAPTDFSAISVGLPGNVPGARYVGMSLWLTQSSIWHSGPRPMRVVEREDIEATAWFDDITVYRLPRVALRSSRPGNVFTEAEPVELRTEVSDPDGLNLSAKLTIFSTDGEPVDERQVPIQSARGAKPSPTIYNDLPVGLYTAELTVAARKAVLVRRSLRFVRVAVPVSPPAEMGRGFGVILRDLGVMLLPGQGELLQALRAEYVKLPVWNAQQAATEPAEYNQTLDRYLEAIVEAHADPIGILTDESPGQGAGQATSLRSMLDLFDEDPLGWKPLIAGVWSRYAGLIHVWQIGDDGDESVFLDDRLAGLVSILRREMRPLMSEPLIATTVSTQYTPIGTRISDYRAATLPATIPPNDVGRHIRPFLGEDPHRVWVTVEPLPDRPYPRTVRLADLSRRLVETCFQNVGGIFLSAPWDTRTGLLSAQVDPREDFIVYRTVADVLGGATPVSRTTIHGHAKCLVFDRNGRAILFVWDEYAPPQGREYVLLLGSEAEQIDLWGRRTPLEPAGSRQLVRIGPVPTFIVDTPTWLMEFRRQFRLEPALLEASFETSRPEVVFCNTYHEPISGVVRLFAPENWEVRPNRIPFSLPAGEEFRQAISIRFPQNAEAGLKPLVGEFSIDATNRYQIIVPAWFELGLEDIDLQTYVYRIGSRVIVRQLMTNRTDRPVNFMGSLVAPGRQRISRSFATFQPGQSLTKDFILQNADELAGRKVRVGLKEIRGSRVWNRVVTIPGRN